MTAPSPTDHGVEEKTGRDGRRRADVAPSVPRRPVRAKVAEVLADIAAWEYWGWVGVALVVLAVVIPVGLLVNRQRTSDAEDAVRARVRELVDFLAAGEGGEACEMLSGRASEHLVAVVEERLVEPDRRSCASAVDAAATSRTAAQDEALGSVDVGEVTYEEEWTTPIGEDPGRFERAVSTVAVPGGTIILVSDTIRTDRPGAWRLNDINPLLDLVVPP